MRHTLSYHYISEPAGVLVHPVLLLPCRGGEVSSLLAEVSPYLCSGSHPLVHFQKPYTFYIFMPSLFTEFLQSASKHLKPL